MVSEENDFICVIPIISIMNLFLAIPVILLGSFFVFFLSELIVPAIIESLYISPVLSDGAVPPVYYYETLMSFILRGTLGFLITIGLIKITLPNNFTLSSVFSRYIILMLFVISLAVEGIPLLLMANLFFYESTSGALGNYFLTIVIITDIARLSALTLVVSKVASKSIETRTNRISIK